MAEKYSEWKEFISSSGYTIKYKLPEIGLTGHTNIVSFQPGSGYVKGDYYGNLSLKAFDKCSDTNPNELYVMADTNDASARYYQAYNEFIDSIQTEKNVKFNNNVTIITGHSTGGDGSYLTINSILANNQNNEKVVLINMDGCGVGADDERINDLINYCTETVNGVPKAKDNVLLIDVQKSVNGIKNTFERIAKAGGTVLVVPGGHLQGTHLSDAHDACMWNTFTQDDLIGIVLGYKECPPDIKFYKYSADSDTRLTEITTEELNDIIKNFNSAYSVTLRDDDQAILSNEFRSNLKNRILELDKEVTDTNLKGILNASSSSVSLSTKAFQYGSTTNIPNKEAELLSILFNQSSVIITNLTNLAAKVSGFTDNWVEVNKELQLAAGNINELFTEDSFKKVLSEEQLKTYDATIEKYTAEIYKEMKKEAHKNGPLILPKEEKEKLHEEARKKAIKKYQEKILKGEYSLIQDETTSASTLFSDSTEEALNASVGAAATASSATLLNLNSFDYDKLTAEEKKIYDAAAKEYKDKYCGYWVDDLSTKNGEEGMKNAGIQAVNEYREKNSSTSTTNEEKKEEKQEETPTPSPSAGGGYSGGGGGGSHPNPQPAEPEPEPEPTPVEPEPTPVEPEPEPVEPQPEPIPVTPVNPGKPAPQPQVISKPDIIENNDTNEYRVPDDYKKPLYEDNIEFEIKPKEPEIEPAVVIEDKKGSNVGGVIAGVAGLGALAAGGVIAGKKLKEKMDESDDEEDSEEVYGFEIDKIEETKE